MSGDTVTGLALQFTNDNNHAYCSSGLTSVNNTETTLLNFKTESYYLHGTVQCILVSGTDDYKYYIYYNDVVWTATQTKFAKLDMNVQSLFVTIPPFTDVKITSVNITDASSQDNVATGNFKVGMPQRVGNLDD